IDLSNNNGLTNLLRQLPLPSSEFRVRRDWVRQARPFLEAGLADTRRPTNEVTMWDWGYMIASLAKAVAVTIYREGWTFPLDNIKIRTLCVALDRLEIYSRADRMNDLLGLRQVLDAAYDEVRKLIEEELVLGNCIYH